MLLNNMHNGCIYTVVFLVIELDLFTHCIIFIVFLHIGIPAPGSFDGQISYNNPHGIVRAN